MGLAAEQPIVDIRLDSSVHRLLHQRRLEDLRVAAQVVDGRRVAANVKQALVVPGSGLVKRAAEAEGLADVFVKAGFEWRAPGCSMCLGIEFRTGLLPGEHCASTSNRNFEGRQGYGRAHPLGQPGHGRGGGGGPATHRREGTAVRAFQVEAGFGGTHGPGECRYGPNHSTSSSSSPSSARASATTCLTLGGFWTRGDIGVTPNERRINHDFVLNRPPLSGR